MKLSIKHKVPLFFAGTIVITAIISVAIIVVTGNVNFFSIHRNLVKKFAYDNSYEILSRNQDILSYKMMLLGKEHFHLRAFFLMDNKKEIVAKYDPNNILDSERFTILREKIYSTGVEDFIQEKNQYFSLMKLETNGMLIGVLGGVFDNPSISEMLFGLNRDVKVSLFIFVLVGLLLVIMISEFLSRQIINPIMEISQFINENNHLSPEFMKTIKIKNQKCWTYKKCNKNDCSSFKNTDINCWDSHLVRENPMLSPCFNCKIFLSREDDEIDRLKIFLNHLISNMRFHYKQSKQYSQSLEDKVNKRTSELREITDDLISANLKTQMIIENVAEWVVVVDKNNHIIQFNQETKDDFFIKSDINIFGSKLEDVWQDKKVGTEVTGIVEKTLSIQQSLETELLYEKEGHKKYFIVKTKIVANEHLGETFVILLIRDNTNAKIVDNFKNDFFHMISHDLKNPLSSVIGFIDLLLNGSEQNKLRDKQRQYLEFASKSANDLKKMLDDLSVIIKMQQRKIELNKENFALNDLFIELQQSFYPLFIRKSTHFKFKVTPNDLNIYADYQRIKQVLSNLIGNAIKSGNKVSIKMEAVQVSTNIIIVVEDNGVGIPEEKIPLLFERFSQLYTYQEADTSLGLGLSIVKNIITLHNGHIHVDSQVDKGTKFTITLPKND